MLVTPRTCISAPWEAERVLNRATSPIFPARSCMGRLDSDTRTWIGMSDAVLVSRRSKETRPLPTDEYDVLWPFCWSLATSWI